MDLPFNISFIEHALEKEKETATWELWRSIYPDMMKGSMDFISYSDYKDKIFSKQHKYTSKTNEEIEQEFAGIVEVCRGR